MKREMYPCENCGVSTRTIRLVKSSCGMEGNLCHVCRGVDCDDEDEE